MTSSHWFASSAQHARIRQGSNSSDRVASNEVLANEASLQMSGRSLSPHVRRPHGTFTRPNSGWAFLSDAEIAQLAEVALKGLVAVELLQRLSRRDVVALLAARFGEEPQAAPIESYISTQACVGPAQVRRGPSRQVSCQVSRQSSHTPIASLEQLSSFVVAGQCDNAAQMQLRWNSSGLSPQECSSRVPSVVASLSSYSWQKNNVALGGDSLSTHLAASMPDPLATPSISAAKVFRRSNSARAIVEPHVLAPDDNRTEPLIKIPSAIVMSDESQKLGRCIVRRQSGSELESMVQPIFVNRDSRAVPGSCKNLTPTTKNDSLSSVVLGSSRFTAPLAFQSDIRQLRSASPFAVKTTCEGSPAPMFGTAVATESTPLASGSSPQTSSSRNMLQSVGNPLEPTQNIMKASCSGQSDGISHVGNCLSERKESDIEQLQTSSVITPTGLIADAWVEAMQEERDRILCGYGDEAKYSQLNSVTSCAVPHEKVVQSDPPRSSRNTSRASSRGKRTPMTPKPRKKDSEDPETAVLHLMNLAGTNSRNGCLTVTEMQTFLRGTRHEDFMLWITKTKQWLKYDTSRSGTIEIKALRSALREFYASKLRGELSPTPQLMNSVSPGISIRSVSPKSDGGSSRRHLSFAMDDDYQPRAPLPIYEGSPGSASTRPSLRRADGRANYDTESAKLQGTLNKFRHDDYDELLAIKTREIQALQRRTEEKMIRGGQARRSIEILEPLEPQPQPAARKDRDHTSAFRGRGYLETDILKEPKCQTNTSVDIGVSKAETNPTRGSATTTLFPIGSPYLT